MPPTKTVDGDPEHLQKIQAMVKGEAEGPSDSLTVVKKSLLHKADAMRELLFLLRSGPIFYGERIDQVMKEWDEERVTTLEKVPIQVPTDRV